MKFSSCLFLILLFCLSFLFAQEQPLPVKTSETKKFPLFYEKIYLHTDRNYYSSGDDIWFKAYLVNAISNILMEETSRILYVELISGDTTYFKQLKINLTNGTGVGDFLLPDSIPTGTYTLRAYTNWMLNFGNIFLFKKELNIVNTQLTTISPQNINITRQPVISFFPEGGSALIEAMNNVAFKAIDEKGNSCEANGVIIDSDNDTLCWFNTMHKGMGVFAYMPLFGKKYYAVGKLKSNYPFKTELPEPLSKGYGIRVTDFDTSYFYVSIYTNQATLDEHPNQQLIINALSHYKNTFTGQIELNDLKQDIRIPKKNFKKGITCITLYDTLFRAHCQRLFNVTKINKNRINIQTDKQVYKPKEKVTVLIKVSDKQGLPVKTKLSFAAVDSKQIAADITNVESYLFLESEIKGKIEEPSKYFDTSNPLRNKQLDLLLLTQGWRDFIWRRVKDTTITIKYMVEPGLSISGWVRQKFDKDPVADMNISLFIPGAIKNTVFGAKTNEKGYFYIEGIESYGTQDLNITSMNQNGKKRGWLILDPFYKAVLPYPALNFETDTSLRNSNFVKESINRKKILQKYSLSDTIELEEIVISASKEKDKRQLESHIIHAGYPDYTYNLTDEDHRLSDLGSFMLQKIPGARTPSETNPGDPFNRVFFNSAGIVGPPRFVVNGIEYKKNDIDDENYIYNIPLSDIEKIMVTKTDIRSLGNSCYVISIFLGKNRSTIKQFHTVNTKFEGYYQARTFYSPVYPENYEPTSKPDLRPTLFWNPTLETNENGECTTSFYNSDKRTTVRISAEGITEDGTPVVITGSYEVK